MKISSNREKWFPLVFILSITMFALVAYLKPGVDFRGYYGAALLVLRGGNPYDYTQLAPVLEEISGFQGNNPYFYPPWYCLLFIPLTYIPFRWAQILWIGVNLLLFYISLEWLWKILNWKIEAWFRWVIFTFASIMFGYASLISENSGIVLFFGLVLTLRSIKKDQPSLAGLGLLLMLTKPQAMLIPVLALGIWALREKPKVVIWAAAWLGLTLVFTTIFFPRWWDFNRENFGLGLTYYQDGAELIVGKRVAATIYDWLSYSFGISDWFSIVIVTLIGGVGLFLVVYTWRYLYDPIYIAASTLLLSFLITPYALQYDFVPLALVFFLVAKALPDLVKLYVVIILILWALVIIVQFFAQLQFQAYWNVLCLTGTYLLFMLNPTNRSPKLSQID